MLFVSCPFLKEGLARIDDSCVSAYEVKGKIFSALVRPVCGRLTVVCVGVHEMASFAT